MNQTNNGTNSGTIGETIGETINPLFIFILTVLISIIFAYACYMTSMIIRNQCCRKNKISPENNL
jgi:hypothetical protein